MKARTVYINDDLWQRIRNAAFAQGRTTSAVIRYILAEALAPTAKVAAKRDER